MSDNWTTTISALIKAYVPPEIAALRAENEALKAERALCMALLGRLAAEIEEMKARVSKLPADPSP